jgi:c-di-GMP-binding flagellar brake protein YcgR
MPYTIGGALRQKKIYAGKQVTVFGRAAGMEFMGKIIEAGGDRLELELFAPPGYPENRQWEQLAVTVNFLVPGDASYSFQASVQSYDDVSQLMRLEQSAPIERVDQRCDYRLKTAKLIYVTLQPLEDGGREKWQQASLLDISRGGVNILSRISADPGEELKVWIPLEEVDHVIETAIEVVRVVVGDEGLMTLGGRFVDISLADQEKVLDYILKVWEEKKDEKPTV